MHGSVLVLGVVAWQWSCVVGSITLAQLRRDAFPESDEDIEDIGRGQDGAEAEKAPVVVLRLGTEIGGRDKADFVRCPGEGVEEEGGHEGDLAGEEEGGDGVG